MKPIINALKSVLILLSMLLSPVVMGSEKPSSDFFAQGSIISDVSLSPDGKKLAFLKGTNGVWHLYYQDLETKKVSYVVGPNPNDKFELNWYRWANNERFIVGYSYFQSTYGYKFNTPLALAINLDRSNVMKINRGKKVKLNNPRFARDSIINILPHDKEHILVQVYGGKKRRDHEPEGHFRERHDQLDAYKLNIYTNVSERVELAGRKSIDSWYSDSEGEVRAAVTISEKHKRILYREKGKRSFKEVLKYDFIEDQSAYTGLIGFTEDNKDLYIFSLNGKDRIGVYKFNPVTKSITDTVISDPTYDVNTIYYDSHTNKPTYIKYISDRSRYVYLDPNYETTAKKIDQALPDRVNRISQIRGDHYIVYSSGDRYSGQYFLGNHKSNSLTPLASRYLGFKPEALSSMEYFSYKARDGLTIYAYLSMPKESDSAGKKVPLVVFPHGGPRSRDVWGFDSMVQMFTNRGYAVFQPNFRGSTEYGKSFEDKGKQQWGLAMQDDITDGVNYLVKQGKIDAKKICIAGWSYGGYAALMGAVKTPGLYKCAIAGAPVTHLEDMIQHDVVREGSNRKLMSSYVGSVWKDSEQLKKTSPALNADKIKVPILLIHGERDSIVPISQSEKMAQALKKHKKDYEFLRFEEMQHSYNDDDRDGVYAAFDEFLQKHLN